MLEKSTVCCYLTSAVKKGDLSNTQKTLPGQYEPGSEKGFYSTASFISARNIISYLLREKLYFLVNQPCTCEYVTLLQSFHRSTLSKHWYIAQNF